MTLESTQSARLAAAACAVALGLTVAAGCGTEGAPADAGDSSSSPDVAADSILAAFRTIAFDYQPVRSEQELQAEATLVVRGTVEKVVESRIRNGTSMKEPFASRTSGVSIDVAEVVKGEVGPQESVWLELDVPTEPLQAAFLPGTPITAYLDPAPQDQPRYRFSNDGSQVPEGARVWVTAHPQGLLVEYGNGTGTVSPLVHEVEPGETVSAPTF